LFDMIMYGSLHFYKYLSYEYFKMNLCRKNENLAYREVH